MVKQSVRRLILIVASFAFLSTLAGCIAYDVSSTIKRDAYFQEQEQNRLNGLPSFSGPYCYPDSHPALLLKICGLSGITLLCSFAFMNPVWSMFTAFFTLSRFPLWYFETQRLLTDSPFYQPQGYDRFLINAGVFDLLGASLTISLALLLLVVTGKSFVQYFTVRRLP